MKTTVSMTSILTTILLSACVTININFPAAATEQVADEIIQGIQKDKPASELKEPVDPGASLAPWQMGFLLTIDNVINVFIPSAHAAGANLSIDSAEIRALRASMAKRYSALSRFYGQGMIGIAKNGLLATPDAGRVPLKERNKVNKLVKAENQDRNKLYAAIARANGHPEWAADIKATFARQWISNAHAGWWYQSGNGAWRQK